MLSTRKGMEVLFALTAILFSSYVYAQAEKSLIGTWEALSIDNVIDGKRTPLYGEHPKGMIVYTEDGHFMYLFTKPDLPKFASNSRVQGTTEENKAVVQGSIGTYGTYKVNPDKKSITQKIEGTTYPNWVGTTQQRMFTVSQDELKIVNPLASTGKGTAELVFRRVK